MSDVLAWGHNPGQRAVKDVITKNGKRKDLTPYPAVIAPWAASDDTGMAIDTTADLIATVDGARYIGGVAAERLPLANRQQDRARLGADSPIYQAFAQMSAQHTGLFSKRQKERPTVLIASALPVAWKLDDATASAQLEAHLRNALRDIATVAGVIVQSEPNALVASELLDDDGQMRKEQAALATGLVCVGDIGGGTANRTVLDQLRALPGQSASPDLGSSQIVRDLAQRAGMQYIDAERRIEAAVATPGQDTIADALLRQYREAVVSDFQQAWKTFGQARKLFGGGTSHWLERDLTRAFPGCVLVKKPQLAIAVGLWRTARRRIARGK